MPGCIGRRICVQTSIFSRRNILNTTTLFSSYAGENSRSDINSYNAIITSFRHDSKNAALSYINMLRDGIKPNQHTFLLLLKSKTHIPYQLFSHVIKLNFDADHFIRSSLIRAFTNNGCVESAHKLFDEMTDRDAITYTALMDGYVRNGLAFAALEIFLEMRVVGVVVDEVAVVSALRAAGMIGYAWLGRWIHGFYVESGRVSVDTYIGSALVDMYCKCGLCEDALRVFQDMPYRNVVSWSTLLAGYMQCSRFEDVLLLFQEMLVDKVEPNEFTLVSVLTACANIGALDQGRWVHKYISVSRLELNSQLGTALIDMYAKCGCIEEAFSVFHKLDVKSVFPWTALIFGMAINGDGPGALKLFNKMRNSGVRPNPVTFLAVLGACSHGGCVNEGKRLFAEMECIYGIKPNVNHYGCMVDLLGRTGQLVEAVKLIKEMPMEPSAGVWGALFGACVIHKEFELGKSVGNHLIMLQPHQSGRYALLANLHGKIGDRKAVADVRKKMKGVRKPPGCSWISIEGVIHEFLASDKSDSPSLSVYDCLNRLTAQMEETPVSFIV